jgi:excisionase family DNA binding protein
MGERLLTVAQTAELLGRSTLAIYRMVERRQIPYCKVGRRLMFRASELEAFIETLPGLSLADLQNEERGADTCRGAGRCKP